MEEARRKEAAAVTHKYHHVTENENDENDEIVIGHEPQDFDTYMDIIDPVENRRSKITSYTC